MPNIPEIKIGNTTYKMKDAELSDSVDDLKSAISSGFAEVVGNEVLFFSPGAYVAPTTTIIGETITYNADYGDVHCAIASCVEGDVFTLHVGGPAGVARAWLFVDANMVALTRSAVNVTTEVTIKAPANAAYVLINNNDSVMPTGYFAYKGNALGTMAYKYIKTLTESDDVNAVIDDGWYTWSVSHHPANIPANAGYTMLVFRRTATSVVQVFFPMTNIFTNVTYRYYSGDAWTDYIALCKKSDLDSIWTAISEVESIVLFPYTDFENGNISATTGKNSTNTKPLRSNYIPISDFVSVDVTGEGYRYQIFAYDATYAYLGMGNVIHNNYKTSRDAVLAAFPTTKYVRIKVNGDSSDTDLDVTKLDEYGYEGFVRITPDTIARADTSAKDTNLHELIEGYADANGVYSGSFAVTFPLSSNPQIVTITAQYTGTMPTIRFRDINPASRASVIDSPYYELGAAREPLRRSWRIPMSSASYTACEMEVTIPSGTTVTIRDAYIHDDQRNRYGDIGVKFHGHTGAVAPANTIAAFQLGAELGYNSMITIPKFTTDGIGICFHDDDSISGALYYMDGSAISGEADKAISLYSYGELTELFRIKSTAWGVLHVPTLEEYFRVCSLTGMNPILSVHSSGFGTTWTEGFQKIRAMAKKWNVLHKLGIKSGNSIVQNAARGVFGTDIDCYVLLSGQTHAPYDQMTIAKAAGFVASDATDLSNCDYKLIAEYFYAQTVSGATYYAETLQSMETEASRGFILSIATTGTNGISGPEMRRLIDLGVTEFTVDHHISMGLDW